MVKFYDGTYLFNIGYPSVVITSQRLRDGDYGAEVFILIQQVPSQKYAVEAHRFSGIGFRETVENPEGILADEALHWTRLHLASRQQSAAGKSGLSNALVECALHEKDWKLELLRMRLRGLADEVIDDIRQTTASEALAARLGEVLKEQPIVVKEVRI